MVANAVSRSALLLAMALFAQPAFAHPNECVVLLHGLGRSGASMLRLQFALQADGYIVWNRGYPSTDAPIEELSPVVGTAVAECRHREAARIHFVTHSMGGILVRHYFQDHRVPEAGRVVMLAPPNHGSEIVDAYRDRWWFRWATGPAGQQLGTGPDALPRRLAPIGLPIGVIAGSASSDPWFSHLFAADHDGKVSVASARLDGMTDLVVVDQGHTFMMNSPAVIAQVKAFLRDGAFAGGQAAPPITP
jgi:triacylglycerol lipase